MAARGDDSEHLLRSSVCPCRPQWLASKSSLWHLCQVTLAMRWRSHSLRVQTTRAAAATVAAIAAAVAAPRALGTPVVLAPLESSALKQRSKLLRSEALLAREPLLLVAAESPRENHSSLPERGRAPPGASGGGGGRGGTTKDIADARTRLVYQRVWEALKKQHGTEGALAHVRRALTRTGHPARAASQRRAPQREVKVGGIYVSTAKSTTDNKKQQHMYDTQQQHKKTPHNHLNNN